MMDRFLRLSVSLQTVLTTRRCTRGARGVYKGCTHVTSPLWRSYS
ncbi:hypothetical protein SAMN04488118_101221 [Epibacterium ulvae]|uniref:Uncharacterized protein n=1 Tax=Epibacterium ulvae TaxID=1156985 RepID=A0A1G5PKX2_9RHOB|nr:hypothetical protein SAMN04488118_101221 [Epibacterium ulvae]